MPADGGDITVDMGPATRLADAEVSVGTSSWKAAGWSMGNPHLVVLDAGPIDALDLTRAPVVDPVTAYPDGVNIELLEPVGDRHVRMRVHERGVGETRSCGTGACAAAVAAMDAAGERVVVPRGRAGRAADRAVARGRHGADDRAGRAGGVRRGRLRGPRRRFIHSSRV